MAFLCSVVLGAFTGKIFWVGQLDGWGLVTWDIFPLWQLMLAVTCYLG